MISPTGKTMLRWLATIALLVILSGLIGHKVVANWQRLSAYQFHLSWWLAVAAVLAGGGYYFFNAQAWRFAVRRSGQEVSPLQAYRLYALSLFGRYVPGKAWLMLIRMELGARVGISRTASGVAVLYENGLQLLSGMGLLVLLGARLWLGSARSEIAIVVIAVGCMVVLAPPIFYGLLNPLLRLFGREPFGPGQRLGLLDLVQMSSYFLGVWACGGMSLYLLGAAVDLNLRSYPLQLSLIFIASQILGFVVLVAPGGLGVREATQIYLLERITTSEQAIILALIARLAMIAAELLQAGLLQVLVRARRRPAGPTGADGP